jgi:hypothetical protein
MQPTNYLRRIRFLVVFFIVALAASGLTAVPLTWELGLLDRLAGSASALGHLLPALGEWISRVHTGLLAAYAVFPQIAYGTDWLAFAHIVIATAFIGALRDPIRNRWVIEFGMLACALLIPWTLLMAVVRHIPWFWQLVDMSFGVLGMIPLWWVRRDILRLESLEK